MAAAARWWRPRRSRWPPPMRPSRSRKSSSASPPPFGGTQRLARLIGRKRALAMILSGAPIPAEEALAIGLVNRVVPPERLLDAAAEMAAGIMAQSPLAVAASLAAVTRGLNLPIAEGLAVEVAAFAGVLHTDDLREGLAAFR